MGNEGNERKVCYSNYGNVVDGFVKAYVVGRRGEGGWHHLKGLRFFSLVLGSQWICSPGIQLEIKLCFLKARFDNHWHNFIRLIVKSSLAEISTSKLKVFFKMRRWFAEEFLGSVHGSVDGMP